MATVQKTIVLEYEGQKIISKPFSFMHSVMVDDGMEDWKESSSDNTQLKSSDIYKVAFPVLKKMFEGTIITDDVLEYEINPKIIKDECFKIFDWAMGVSDRIKNS